MVGWQVVIHTGIHHFQLETMLSAKEINSTISVCEMNSLLPSYFPGGYTDTLCFDTMVGTEDNVLRAL